MYGFRKWTLAICSCFLLGSSLVGQENGTIQIHIDADAPTTAFPHFWEKTFGSGRAILSLRESYRKDIETVKSVTGFESVRFHGILTDEVGLYDPDRVIKNPGLAAEAVNDSSPYNFMYIDQIYDGLLSKGIKPFVELSFMPRKLAADPNALHPFFYHPIVSPPKDYKLWDEMIQAFAAHLVARYGINEVSTWKFEVWNEPNLDFWGGAPKQSTYWDLYDHTARAIKSVSLRLQVGGPATAQAAWVPDFLAHVYENHIPVDFVSTHVYGNDSAPNVLGTSEDVPRDQMVYRAVKKVHDQIASSPLPHLPLIFSEYGASYSNEPNVTDSPYMGPWLANTIRQCDGLVENLAYWTFSDVFEEQGVARSSYYGGFGVIAPNNIPKASLNALAILHKLGDRRMAVDSDSVLATKLSDGNLAVALWNYVPPGGSGPNYTQQSTLPGAPRTFIVQLEHFSAMPTATVYRVDSTHGNSLALFDQMGRPENLSPEQISRLQKAGSLSPAEPASIQDGRITTTVPPYGLVVLLIRHR
ncbi:GH39 family glycosyl hydrolase [Acidicapsa acidisoli]|uniref:GH39 family glycosyl hydrolase n=1 Tax=Acidicapsa acidisoli TaxID=1615681 RepID=UPI0021E0F948|nr:glycosyl hydrolase family 39 [Acidicapsa acidisoli]